MAGMGDNDITHDCLIEITTFFWMDGGGVMSMAHVHGVYLCGYAVESDTGKILEALCLRLQLSTSCRISSTNSSMRTDGRKTRNDLH